jgi:hypothetical protein
MYQHEPSSPFACAAQIPWMGRVIGFAAIADEGALTGERVSFSGLGLGWEWL